MVFIRFPWLQRIAAIMYITYVIVLDAEVPGDTVRGHPDLILLRDNVTWTDGYLSCSVSSAAIAMSLSKAEKQAIDLMITEGERVWIGQYTESTPWMYSTGCYKLRKDPDYRMTELNGAAACSRACNGSDFYLSVDNCDCAEDNSTLSELIDFSKCKTLCRESDKEVCGGPEASLYYTQYNSITENPFDGKCAIYERTGGSKGIHARRCQTSYVPLCMYYNSTTNTTDLKILKRDGRPIFVDYETAVWDCVEDGGLLVNPKIIHGENYYTGTDPTQYWTGLRRWERHIESVKELPHFLKGDKCLYIVKESQGISRDRTLPCIDSRALVVCRKAIVHSGDSTTSPVRPDDTSTSTPFGISTTDGRGIVTTTTSTGNENNTETYSSGTKDPPLTGINLYITIGVSAFILLLGAVCAAIVLNRRRFCAKEKSKKNDILELNNIDQHDYMDIEMSDNQHKETVPTRRAETCCASGAIHNTKDNQHGTANAKHSNKINTVAKGVELNTMYRAENTAETTTSNFSNEDKNVGVYDSACVGNDQAKVLQKAGNQKTSGSDRLTGENSTYDMLHTHLNKAQCNNDDVYDHATVFPESEGYHTFAIPGHASTNTAHNVYDSVNTSGGDMYNTFSSDKTDNSQYMLIH